MQGRWLAAFFVLVGLAVPASAQKAVKLEWKFKEGTAFYQEITTETKQEMSISGQKINQTQTQKFYFSWTPEKYDKSKKTWTVKQKIIGVKMTIEIGGNTISYDSVKDSGQNNPLGEFFKQLVDSEFTLTIDDQMKVAKVEGKDKFIDKLVKANAQMDSLLKEILTDDAIKQMADPTFGALPDKAVKKGDKWERKSTLNMGPIGKYETDYTYTFEGEKDKKDTIKVETKLKYTPPAPGTQPQLPFKIKKADLKSVKGKKDETGGSIVFDSSKGRIDKSTMKLKLKGTLDIDIGGQETKVDLEQTQTTTVTTTSENPISKKS
jgi:hypothetical protein